MSRFFGIKMKYEVMNPPFCTQPAGGHLLKKSVWPQPVRELKNGKKEIPRSAFLRRQLGISFNADIKVRTQAGSEVFWDGPSVSSDVCSLRISFSAGFFSVRVGSA